MVCFFDQSDIFLISGFHTMGGEGAMSTYKVCIGPNLTCMNDLLNRMGQFDHVDYNGEQVNLIIILKNAFFLLPLSKSNERERMETCFFVQLNLLIDLSLIKSTFYFFRHFFSLPIFAKEDKIFLSQWNIFAPFCR